MSWPLHAEHPLVEVRRILQPEVEAGESEHPEEEDTGAHHGHHSRQLLVDDGVVMQAVDDRDELVHGQEECRHLERDDGADAEGEDGVAERQRGGFPSHDVGDADGGQGEGAGESEQRQHDDQGAPGLVTDAALAGQDEQEGQEHQHQQKTDTDTGQLGGDHGSQLKSERRARLQTTTDFRGCRLDGTRRR